MKSFLKEVGYGFSIGAAVMAGIIAVTTIYTALGGEICYEE